MSTALPVEVVKRMRELRCAGIATTAIAAELGVSESCVKKYGPRPSPKRRALLAAAVPKMKKLRLQGLSQRAVARQVGVCAETVSRRVPGIDLRQLPPEFLPMMLRLDRQGFTRTQIARSLGLHINTVVKHMLRNGRPRKRP